MVYLAGFGFRVMLVSWNEYGNDRFLVRLFPLKNTDLRTSLAVWWLRFHTSSAGGAGLIPGLGTRSHMLCGMAKKRYRF